MTVREILSDENCRRWEFPVTARQIFLAHAGVAPLPRRVIQAVEGYLTAASEQDQETFVLGPLLKTTRERAARLLGALPEEIAFVGPTSIGLSHVATGLPLEPGSNILVYFDDFPSNVYPWLTLADKGVEVRFLRARSLGAITVAELEPLIDRNTRLVALGSCHFISGLRIDIAAIGQFLQDRGIFFCLDAIQTLGAFPISARWVDFLAADAHKWLLGPCGAGIFFVRKELQEKLAPPLLGWNNVRCPNYVAQEKVVFRKGGQRYEAGTYNLTGLVGLSAALELILELGVETIAAELLRKRDRLVAPLRQLGFTVDEPDRGLAPSGIVSAYKPGTDLRQFHARLEQHKVIASLRFDRNGQNYLRFSPHFYNSEAELETVVRVLSQK